MRTGLIILIFATFLLSACGKEAGQVGDREKSRQAAISVLDQYYEAVGNADFDSFIALFSPTAKFYGTDASEIWSYTEFAPSIKQSFKTGVGWDFELKDRQLTLSQSGDIAWFSELAHFNNTDYLLRPSGVLEKQDGSWKFVQLVMGIPIPNQLYTPVLQGMQATKLGELSESQKIDKVLDDLHQFAAQAKAEAYFNQFTEDAIFIGTDVTERWNIAQFKEYAAPIFSKGRGWKYTPRQRHISLSPMSNIAWFDEILDSKTYGTSRGTGTLVRSKDGWKISQYQLTFPIPNQLASDITSMIKTFESKNDQAADKE
ncbi:hypothetical protein MNBD_ALPHA06-1089 [hydrothermal vent metagenome]|uniref:SnoaL-like domain-containing protein n=1 Tax=hydrothermal vent metagenome TaxID=652676 RepID=A0A3B0RIU5_9ZZZZ